MNTEEKVAAVIRKIRFKRGENFRRTGLPVPELISRCEADNAHKHHLVDRLDVAGTAVVIYDIPTLSKKLILADTDGVRYQGYKHYKQPSAEPQKPSTKDQLNALISELAEAGKIEDHDDLDQTEVEMIEQIARQRGIPLPRTAAEKARVERTAEIRKTAKAHGGYALKGTSKQKAWAEQIRAGALGKMFDDSARKIVNDPRMQHSKFWIEGRKKIQEAVSYGSPSDVEEVILSLTA